MKEELVTDALLRQFLLGKVDDEERQRIEILFMTDPLSRERILVVEQDLIEDYLEDCLTTEDRERFLLQYDTPEQRRKLRITKSIKEWGATEAKVTRTGPSRISIWRRLRVGIRLKPVFVIPIAVTSIIAIVVAAVWLNRKTELRNREHLAIQQEVARLNDPSNLREVPPQMLSLKLTPVSVRSLERETELTTVAEIQFVELRLLSLQKELYSTYRAVIRRFDDEDTLTVGDLHAENDGGKAVRIRLPAHMLRRGLYQIHLSGIAADGTTGLVEEYKFTVAG